jgi:hypothetical protein
MLRKHCWQASSGTRAICLLAESRSFVCFVVSLHYLDSSKFVPRGSRCGKRREACPVASTLTIVPDVRILLVSAVAPPEKSRQAAGYRIAAERVVPMFSRTPVITAAHSFAPPYS